MLTVAQANIVPIVIALLIGLVAGWWILRASAAGGAGREKAGAAAPAAARTPAGATAARAIACRTKWPQRPPTSPARYWGSRPMPSFRARAGRPTICRC